MSAYCVDSWVIRRPLVLSLDLLLETRGMAAVRVYRGEPRLQEAGLRAYTHLAASTRDRTGKKVYPRASQSQRHSAGLGGDRDAMIPRHQ